LAAGIASGLVFYGFVNIRVCFSPDLKPGWIPRLLSGQRVGVVRRDGFISPPLKNPGWKTRLSSGLRGLPGGCGLKSAPWVGVCAALRTPAAEGGAGEGAGCAGRAPRLWGVRGPPRTHASGPWHQQN